MPARYGLELIPISGDNSVHNPSSVLPLRLSNEEIKKESQESKGVREGESL